MTTRSLAALAALAAACATPPPAPTAPPAQPAPEAKKEAAPAPPKPAVETVTLGAVGLDAEAMDRKVNPCDDFYQYACGGWIEKTQIPADKSRWSRSFSEIDKRNEEDLHQILEKARTEPGEDPVLKKVGAFYGACMNEEAIEKNGTKAIDKLLGLAASVKDGKTLALAIIELQKNRVFVPWDISGEQDFKDATRVVAYLDQNGLGLPDRDYYVNDDEKSKSIRKEYQAHVERMLKLAGLQPAVATKGAQSVMTLETELAKVSKTKVERRDPAGLYNKIDLAGLKAKTPAFPWDEYLKALGRPDVTDIVVTSVPFFEGVQKLLKTAKTEDWRNYLQWQIVRSTAQLLPKKFVDESFALTKVLTGQDEVEVRWKRCVGATDDALGELLAQPYITLRFAGESKPATEQMVAEISKAFGENLDRLEWMDADTRKRAHEKRTGVVFHIGYPEKWKAYEFDVSATDFASNALASRRYELKRTLDKIGKPVDRQEWLMSPPTVNAYYNPQKNEMVFPAGILQPPFFDVKAGVAVNMGGMGMVVGHELTHGFDDEGSQFDKDGNLKTWWEEPTRKQFDEKTACVEKQYAGYEAVAATTADGKELPAVKLNGKLTLGENIADLGGVKLAFQAYRSMRAKAEKKVVADGFTEDQQFFLAVGQAWCTKAKEQVMRMLAQVDPHSPPRFRVNGSLTNVPEFAEAFQCPVGTPMRPKDICKVW